MNKQSNPDGRTLQANGPTGKDFEDAWPSIRRVLLKLMVASAVFTATLTAGMFFLLFTPEERANISGFSVMLSAIPIFVAADLATSCLWACAKVTQYSHK